MKFVKVLRMIRKKTETIIPQAAYLTNTWQHAKGLMFTFKMKHPLVFAFNKERRVPLHMFFVFYPIDVIYLDSKKTVVEMKENFKPFTKYNPKHKAKYVIEVENGFINSKNIQLNDVFDFRE
ncbi:MAG: uncharacterized protein PWP03_836 [Candidatus Woesearchaeota archaeon]|nr:uncharacterized protein [Candidatus Woesearchaeota archaeon]MDN5328198.1 uncharacterized protein [Candidatus Woesearchaeota archaeon]